MGVDQDAPLYARALRLRHIHPGTAACLGLFEGVTAVAALLAFAELASWWAVLVLPLTVAAMVKLNDVIVGTFALDGKPNAGDRWPSSQLIPLGVGSDLLRAAGESSGRHCADEPILPGEEYATVYGSPRPPDDDLTPAIGWARRHSSRPSATPERRSHPNNASGSVPSDADGVCRGRSPLNQGRFI